MIDFRVTSFHFQSMFLKLRQNLKCFYRSHLSPHFVRGFWLSKKRSKQR